MSKKGFTHESQHNESKEWYTPKYIFDALGISFDLDPCSPGCDVVPWIPAKTHFTIDDDGLRKKKWFGNVWLNPPYGSDTSKWLRRLRMHGNGIALVFARTDNEWFHKHIPHAHGICFIRKRVQFIQAHGAKLYRQGKSVVNRGSGAGSMLVVFGENNARIVAKSQLGLFIPLRQSSGLQDANFARNRAFLVRMDDHEEIWITPPDKKDEDVVGMLGYTISKRTGYVKHASVQPIEVGAFNVVRPCLECFKRPTMGKIRVVRTTKKILAKRGKS